MYGPNSLNSGYYKISTDSFKLKFSTTRILMFSFVNLTNLSQFADLNSVYFCTVGFGTTAAADKWKT